MENEENKIIVSKDENQDLKDMVIQNTVESFLADEKTKQKLISALGAVAIPAYKSIIKKLGDDEFRYMLYHDKQYGLVIQKLTMATSDINFEDPTAEDITIINQDHASNLSEFLLKMLSIPTV